MNPNCTKIRNLWHDYGKRGRLQLIFRPYGNTFFITKVQGMPSCCYKVSQRVLDYSIQVHGFHSLKKTWYLLKFINRKLEKLQKEIQLGRMLGPFSEKPLSTLRISPIGLVLKPDNGWRLITHLSFPVNYSVNDFIDDAYCKVKYSSFDNVLEMISSLGKGTELARVDIRQAFRLLIVNPADFDLLGIQFVNKYYIDKCLPMGCAISCSRFEKFSTFLHWVVKSKS